MTLQEYMEFTHLSKGEKVHVYIDMGYNGAQYISDFCGVGNGDIEALDTLMDFMDNNVIEQFMGFQENELFVLIEGVEK